MLCGSGAQIVQNQMDGIGAGVVLGNLQDEIGEFRRRARGRHLGECTPALGSMPQNTFAVPQRLYS